MREKLLNVRSKSFGLMLWIRIIIRELLMVEYSEKEE